MMAYPNEKAQYPAHVSNNIRQENAPPQYPDNGSYSSGEKQPRSYPADVSNNVRDEASPPGYEFTTGNNASSSLNAHSDLAMRPLNTFRDFRAFQDDTLGCAVLPAQTLQVYHPGFLSRGKTVTLEDKKTVLYSAEYHQWSNPDVNIRRGGEAGTAIGVRLRSVFSGSRIEVTLASNGKTYEMEKDGFMHVRYIGVAPNGTKYTWKTTRKDTSIWSGENFKCVDENGTVIARFMDSSYKAVSKEGKLEIYANMTMDMLDWVTGTVLGLVEKESRRNNSNTAV